jgi:hypothetical protein
MILENQNPKMHQMATAEDLPRIIIKQDEGIENATRRKQKQDKVRTKALIGVN